MSKMVSRWMFVTVGASAIAFAGCSAEPATGQSQEGATSVSEEALLTSLTFTATKLTRDNTFSANTEALLRITDLTPPSSTPAGSDGALRIANCQSSQECQLVSTTVGPWTRTSMTDPTVIDGKLILHVLEGFAPPSFGFCFAVSVNAATGALTPAPTTPGKCIKDTGGLAYVPARDMHCGAAANPPLPGNTCQFDGWITTDTSNGVPWKLTFTANGACQPTGLADDNCDGVDDDCVGGPDDKFPVTATSCGVGACARTGQQACVNGAVTNSCTPGQSSIEVCDGVDNNCNNSVDEQFPFHVTCGGAGACAGSQTFTCVNGVPGATACTGVSQPTTEVLDGFDNDCDGEIDECGPNDFWCSCTGQDVVFQVNLLDDGANADAEANSCRPGAQSTGNCRLRGVFRQAELLDARGCRAVAQLPIGTLVTNDELRLRYGNLTLRGAGGGACSSVITTQSPCDPSDCKCSTGAQHRIINAIRDGGNALALTLDGVTVSGGRNEDTGDFTAGSASGGITMEHGDLTVIRSIIQNNHSRGTGAGIAAYLGGTLRITDSVIRNNRNLQASEKRSGVCLGSAVAGGLTGPGGGIYAGAMSSIIIENSAIIGNVAPDGGGLNVVGGALTMTNTTVSGNHSGGIGGGLYSQATSTTLAFTTFSRNVSGEYVTLSPPPKNGGGVRVSSGTLDTYGNVFAQNYITQDGGLPPSGLSADCSVAAGVTVLRAGTNLIGWGGQDCAALGPTTSPLIGPDPDATLGIDARLAPLSDNACPSPLTSIHATLPSSPATAGYATSNSPACPSEDQRHFARTAGAACTLGAYETNAVAAFRHFDVTSCVYAEQALTVRDRADLTTDAFAGSFAFSNDAELFGALLSGGGGSLGNRAIVYGSAALRGTLTGLATNVRGTLQQQVQVPLQSLLQRPVTAGTSNVTVALNTTTPLAPGAYGTVVVRSRGKLRLTGSGAYRFASLTFEPDSFLDVVANATNVSLAATGAITLGDRVKMSVGGVSTPSMTPIFVYTNGARIDLGTDVLVAGSLEAPSGTIELRDRAVVTGCTGARNVTIGADAKVGNGAPTLGPLPAWPRI
jgi:hypothetical protein